MFHLRLTSQVFCLMSVDILHQVSPSPMLGFFVSPKVGRVPSLWVFSFWSVVCMRRHVPVAVVIQHMHEHLLRTGWMHSKCRFLFILFVIWMYCVCGGCTPAHCVDMIWFGILCMCPRDHNCNVFFECCVIVCCLFVKVCLFVRAVFSPNTFFSLRPPPCRRPTSSRPVELVAASSVSS